MLAGCSFFRAGFAFIFVYFSRIPDPADEKKRWGPRKRNVLIAKKGEDIAEEYLLAYLDRNNRALRAQDRRAYASRLVCVTLGARGNACHPSG